MDKLKLSLDGVEIVFDDAVVIENLVRSILEYQLMNRVYPEIEFRFKEGQGENTIRDYLKFEAESLSADLLYELMSIADSIFTEIRDAVEEKKNDDDVPF